MMQTPISFALDILLDCDTIEKAHKAARRYIKVLEACGSPPTIRNFQTVGPMQPGAIQQAPSTQRLLEQHAVAAPPPPIIPRNVGGEVNNGDGTKGKRKW